MNKILCLASYQLLPANTGGQKSIDTFYQNLSKEFEVIVISTRNNDVSQAKGYRMMNILSNSPLRYINIFYFFKLKKIIRQETPDYLQLEHPYYGWLAILVALHTKTSLIVRSHNIEGLRFKNLNKWWWPILMKYEGWVHRNAQVNYFISDEDKAYAVKKFHLPASASHTITFGIDQPKIPAPGERRTARDFLCKKYGFNEASVIILFNGAFDYKPNLVALHNLIHHIFPSINNPNYKLLVCGKNIPSDLIACNTNSNIVYAGFVPDIYPFLLGSLLFVNPLTEGGGIKTKLVEALGFNLTSVSFNNGAIGVPAEVCGEKLLVVEDYRWNEFAEAIKRAATITSDTPLAFYDHFSYKGIMRKVKTILK